MLKVHKDISLNIDTGKITALTLLYLSAAFDTIEFPVVPDHISDWYGSAYSINKNKKLFFRGSAFVLRCSPRLCSWTATVYPVYNATKLSYSQPQIRPPVICRWHPSIISLTTADTYLSRKQLTDCLGDISGWMTNNKPRLNANKIYFIIIGTSRKAINLLVSSLCPSLVIASHHQILYVILVLHLIAILISENIFPNMWLLLLSYSWSSSYLSLYISFRR